MGMPKLGGMTTVRALAARYVADRASKQEIARTTIRTLRCNLDIFARTIDDPDLKDFGRVHIDLWKQRVNLAPATIRTRLSQIRGFVEWAILNGHLDHDPTVGVRSPRQPRRVPRNFQSEQVRLVYAACRDTREILVLALMVQEGLRAKEVVGLELGDIDFDAGVMLIRGKGDHERVLPMSDDTMAVVARYLIEWPATAGPLVRSVKDGRSGLAPVTVGRMVSRLMMAAGVKQRAYDGRSGHALRHTAATDMLQRGAHLRDVQAALGHQSLATTERYLAWEVKGLREAMGGRHYW